MNFPTKNKILNFVLGILSLIIFLLIYLGYNHHFATYQDIENANNHSMSSDQNASAYLESSINNQSIQNVTVPQKQDMILGSKDAKIILTEYSSLACPFCAKFHEEYFYKLKKDYIDTGLIKYVHRDFPTNKASLIAALVGYCNQTRRLDWIDMLYKTQDTWLLKKDPVEAIKNIAVLGGAENINECILNKDIEREMMENAYKAFQNYKVTATPTFFVNNTKVMTTITYENIIGHIEKELRAQHGK